MSDNNANRIFQCRHCAAGIQVPANLPPTTAACPKCGELVTSPDWDAAPAEPRVQASEQAEPVVERLEPASKTDKPAAPKSENSKPSSGKGKMIVAIATLGAALLLAAAAIKILVFSDPKKTTKASADSAQPLSQEERRDNIYRTRGWIEDAKEVLQNFFDAKTNEERAAWTIRGSVNEAEMAAIYEKFEEDSFRNPVDIFSPVPLADSDTKRGIFLMAYNRPEQFTIRSFFRPVPPLRVRYGLEQADNWLISEASVSNFVDRPLRIMAFFGKTEDGLKLDWQVYAQTKYRLLDKFVTNPEPGARGVFRVFIQEDVDLDGRDGNGFSIFRVSDPANGSDYAKVLVKDESELGFALSSLKWRDRVIAKPPLRNATVSLVWSDEPEPSLQMDELICWEFLGLGGERGNWKVKTGE